MSPIVYDPPERCVAGAVGPPGQRTFFLQASEGTRRTTVSLEKEQVRLLAPDEVGVTAYGWRRCQLEAVVARLTFP